MRGPSRRHRIRNIGSGLVLVLAAAACSNAPAGAGATSGSAGSTPAGPGALSTIPPVSLGSAADKTDYCTLFTAAEIGAILGKAVGAGSGSGFVCTWTAADGVSAASIYRSLPVLYDEAAAQPDHHPVSGIGDKAAIGPSLLGGTEAIALSNGAYWLVRLSPSPSDDTLLGFLRELISRGQ
jgi:hypothetical protein